MRKRVDVSAYEKRRCDRCQTGIQATVISGMYAFNVAVRDFSEINIGFELSEKDYYKINLKKLDVVCVRIENDQNEPQNHRKGRIDIKVIIMRVAEDRERKVFVIGGDVSSITENKERYEKYAHRKKEEAVLQTTKPDQTANS